MSSYIALDKQSMGRYKKTTNRPIIPEVTFNQAIIDVLKKNKEGDRSAKQEV